MALILLLVYFFGVVSARVPPFCVFKLILQAAAGNHFVSFGELEAGFSAELPLDGGCPALGDGGEVQEHDAEVQLAVKFGVVLVGLADEGDAAVADYEAVGLAVQIAGSQGGCVEGFPQHVIEESDVLFNAFAVAPGVHEDHVVDTELGVYVVALGGDVHIGHALDIEPETLGGLYAVAECYDGGYFQFALYTDGLLYLLAFGEGEPAAVKVQVGQFDYQVFHDVAGVLYCVLCLLGEKYQIMGCAYQVAAVSGCSFKSFPCLGAQHQQFGLVFGEQSLYGLAVVFLDALQFGSANCFFNKGPYGLTILYQCAVIHVFLLLMF